MSELKPCPFCGRKPYESGGYVSCHTEECLANADYHEPAIGSIEDWNTRPIEDALNARIARLEGKLAELVEVGNKMRDLIEQDYDAWVDETIDWRGMAEEADDVLQEREE